MLKATHKLGKKAHRRLKLLGAVMCEENNHKYAKINPVIPVLNKIIKSNSFVLLFLLQSLKVMNSTIIKSIVKIFIGLKTCNASGCSEKFNKSSSLSTKEINSFSFFIFAY